MTTHRIRPALAVAALALATLVSFAGSARAFNIIGTPSANPSAGVLTPPSALPPTFRFRHWDLREFDICKIPFALNAAGTADSGATGGFAAMEAACERWGTVTTTPLSIIRQPNTATAACAQDGENVLWFDNNNSSGFFGGAGSWSSILGVTTIWTQATYRITESDIVFNDRDWQWGTSGDDFTAVTTGFSEPFAIATGDSLLISVNGGAAKAIRFDATNMATPGSATALEVKAAIEANVPGTKAFAYVDGTVQVISTRADGQGTIQVTGGPAGADANVALGFATAKRPTRVADIETVCLHEFGHFLGLHHSSNDGSEPNPTYTNAVMYAYAPSTGSKRALTQDDKNAINFLYLPDLGDAPEAPALHYQTLVHTTTKSRTLSGMQLYQPGIGPGALFAHGPDDSLRYEWLGATVQNPYECEARVVNLDLGDDGLTTPEPLVRGMNNHISVTIRYRDPNPSRYWPITPNNTMYLNGYWDFDGDRQFTPADRQIWWQGTPNGTIAASPSWTGSVITPGQIVIFFDVIPSLISPDSGYARIRLDLGEDEGRVANYNGDLGPAVGISQFGEVEDYPYTLAAYPTAVKVASFTATIEDDGVHVAWSTPSGGSSPIANLYRRNDGTAEDVLVASRVLPGPDGAEFVDSRTSPGTSYTYRLGLFDGGKEVAGPSISVRVPARELAFAGVSPNPVADRGSVRFSLPAAGRVKIALYSIAGRLERVLADGVFTAGEQSVPWDGRDVSGGRLSSGIYFLRMETAGATRVARMVVVR